MCDEGGTRRFWLYAAAAATDAISNGFLLTTPRAASVPAVCDGRAEDHGRRARFRLYESGRTDTRQTTANTTADERFVAVARAGRRRENCKTRINRNRRIDKTRKTEFLRVRVDVYECGVRVCVRVLLLCVYAYSLVGARSCARSPLCVCYFARTRYAVRVRARVNIKRIFITRALDSSAAAAGKHWTIEHRTQWGLIVLLLTHDFITEHSSSGWTVFIIIVLSWLFILFSMPQSWTDFSYSSSGYIIRVCDIIISRQCVSYWRQAGSDKKTPAGRRDSGRNTVCVIHASPPSWTTFD